ncbi:MAG: hypothetical protein HY898_29035 [Deltaproteobacteria bacterium]|nr:hypothetical protein [Deltaproteobacteria bacterium]
MSSVRGSRATAWVLAIGMMVLAAPAPAQQDTKRAETLFQEGKKLLDAGKTDPACAKLQESYGLDPAVGTLGMLAHCHEIQGKRALAWREYIHTAELAQKAGQAKREQVARDLAANLEKSMPSVRINVAERIPDLSITRGGEVVPDSEWGKPIPVDPGAIEIRASASGRKSWMQTIQAPAGHSVIEVSVPALKAEKPEAGVAPVASAAPTASASEKEPPPEKEPPVEPPKQEPAASGGSIVPGLIVTGVGVVGIGLGSVFGLRAMSKNSDSKAYCNDSNECSAQGGDLRDQAKSSALISTIGFGVGAAGIGVGLIMLLSSGGSAKEKSASRVWIAPEAGANHAGLGLRGRF